MASEIPDRPAWAFLTYAGVMTVSSDITISTIAWAFGADIFGKAALPILGASFIIGGGIALAHHSLVPRIDDNEEVFEDLPKRDPGKTSDPNP
jgi:hypothetical protein